MDLSDDSDGEEGVDLVDLKKEISVLMELDHPNITKYISCYEDKKKFYILMELVEGGTLTKKIEDTQNYNE